MRTFQHISFCLRSTVSVALLAACSCHTSESRYHDLVKISPGFSEAQIRTEVLKYTALGSKDTDVMNFARTRLKHASIGPSYNRPDTIIVLLGRHGCRLIGSNDTWVQWRFDEAHKLTDVEVIKSSDTL